MSILFSSLIFLYCRSRLASLFASLLAPLFAIAIQNAIDGVGYDFSELYPDPHGGNLSFYRVIPFEKRLGFGFTATAIENQS